MKAILPHGKSSNLMAQAKDILIAAYMISMVFILVAVLFEVKIYFAIDVVPGMDIPIDEWYASAFQ